MKFAKLFVLAVAMIIAAGCGSSSGTTSNTNATADTPASTSAKSAAALMSFGSTGINGIGSVMGTFSGNAGASSIKSESTSVNISCNWAEVASLWNFTCVAWDSQGSATSDSHKCDIVGSMNADTYSFDIAYDCYTLMVDENTTVDGNYAASITIDSSFFSDEAAMTLGKGYKTDTQTSDECSLSDASTDFEDADSSCTWDNSSTPICVAQDAIFTLSYTVGARGVTVIDECGTYTLGSGTNMIGHGCELSDVQMDVSFTLDGTFNGEDVNTVYNVSCDDL